MAYTSHENRCIKFDTPRFASIRVEPWLASFFVAFSPQNAIRTAFLALRCVFGTHPRNDTTSIMTEIDAANETSEHKPHVLLVDDDVEIVESMRYALEGDGFQVSVAHDGNQGLALAEKTTPDLLILDMMMPKRSGFLVLEQLRRDGNDRVRVIMITGNEGSRHQQYAELLGVDDYIRKPFPMDRLLQSARTLLNLN